MTLGPAAPLGNTAGFPHRLGPWVVAYGTGSAAERCAEGLVEECLRRNFDSRPLPTEESALLPLDRFKSVIIIAPTSGLDGDPVALLRPSNDLAAGYRARRPDGLAAARAGRVDPSEAGVLQIIGPGDLLRSPAARTLLERACATHDITDDPQRDAEAIFGVYEMEISGSAQTTPVALGATEILQLWAGVQEWGLRSLHDVEIVLARINQLRMHYNYNARPALRRPLGETVPRSRFDFILEAPHDPERPGQFKNWKPDGAEVLREVITDIQANALPAFANPRRTRNATDRFTRFYKDLRLLSLYAQVTPESERVPFPSD